MHCELLSVILSILTDAAAWILHYLFFFAFSQGFKNDFEKEEGQFLGSFVYRVDRFPLQTFKLEVGFRIYRGKSYSQRNLRMSLTIIL